MESVEVRFFKNRDAKKNAKNIIFGTIRTSKGQISHIKLALLRKVYCEEMSDTIEHEISQLTKKQTLLYSPFRELELEKIKLPSILKIDYGGLVDMPFPATERRTTAVPIFARMRTRLDTLQQL